MTPQSDHGYTAKNVLTAGKRWRIRRERREIGGLFSVTVHQWVVYADGMHVFETRSSALAYQITYLIDRDLRLADHNSRPVVADPDDP